MIWAMIIKKDADYRANLEAAAKKLVEDLADLSDAEVEEFFQGRNGLLLRAVPIVHESFDAAAALDKVIQSAT